jgi:hypothetical protein
MNDAHRTRNKEIGCLCFSLQEKREAGVRALMFPKEERQGRQSSAAGQMKGGRRRAWTLRLRKNIGAPWQVIQQQERGQSCARKPKFTDLQHLAIRSAAAD